MSSGVFKIQRNLAFTFLLWALPSTQTYFRKKSFPSSFYHKPTYLLFLTPQVLILANWAVLENHQASYTVIFMTCKHSDAFTP